ncbi:phosphopantetheine-binding protein [Streptomyces sp. 7R007]
MSDRAPHASPGRRLLLELVDVPGLFDGLDDDADLLSAGINSGELIRLALAIEERTGVPLDDEEMTALYTIDGIDRVLAAAGVSG